MKWLELGVDLLWVAAFCFSVFCNLGFASKCAKLELRLVIARTLLRQRQDGDTDKLLDTLEESLPN